MTLHTSTNPRTLTQLAADIRQLREPIHAAVRGRVITHDPLLDQLRDAATPSGNPSRGPERRDPPGPRPPARLDAVDTLGDVYIGISTWHRRLGLASPSRDTDWQKTALNQIADNADRLAPSIAEWLAIDVHGWWVDAARAAGWRPADLIKLR